MFDGVRAHGGGSLCVVWLLSLSVPWTACAPPSFEGSQSAIANGSLEPDMPAVVAVITTRSTGERALCTGSLVRSNRVITARHCLTEHDDWGSPEPSELLPPEAVEVRFGTQAFEPEATAAVSAVGAAARRVDLAVLTLATEVDHPTIAIAESPALVGERAIIAGYGRTEMGGAGSKHRAEVEISQIDTLDRPRFYYLEGVVGVCSGDSGGPLLNTDGELVGVASAASESCGSVRSVGGGTLVGPHRFLLDNLAAGCVASTEVCNGVDDDCDGQVDNACAAERDRCRSGDECGGGDVCVSIVGVPECAQTCDVESDCPETFSCIAGHCEGALNWENHCVAGATGYPGGCLEGLTCTDVGAAWRCLCDDGCPSGRSCLSGVATDRACPPPLEYGDECASDRQCWGGLCVGGHCRQRCDSANDCPVPQACASRDDVLVCLEGEPAVTGCAATGGPISPGPLVPLVGWAWFLAVRRRRPDGRLNR